MNYLVFLLAMTGAWYILKSVYFYMIEISPKLIGTYSFTRESATLCGEKVEDIILDFDFTYRKGREIEMYKSKNKIIIKFVKDNDDGGPQMG